MGAAQGRVGHRLGGQLRGPGRRPWLAGGPGAPRAAGAARGAGGGVVVVESPTKATKLQGFLPASVVLATKGHVRDLLAKQGSIAVESDSFDMSWTPLANSREPVQKIREALSAGASRLVLATDPDREGEAISWHLKEMLEEEGLLEGLQVERVAFTEVTKTAVAAAMSNPRAVDAELVDAYRARRALDYLVGFTLSPLLWTKVPGTRSAGRVQSVALRLVAEREQEIEAFRESEYWSVDAVLTAAGPAGAEGAPFTAGVTHVDGEKLGKTALGSREAAERVEGQLRAAALRVASVKRAEVKQRPAPPFKTSTLQQAASGALGYSASRTMSLAQALYEGKGSNEGLITYMRTDGLFVAPEALADARAFVAGEFGDAHVPAKPRFYTRKAKNSQEAHEAIRPTSVARLPSQLPAAVDPAARRLYALIWERAVASQMADARFERATVGVADAEGALRLSGTARRRLFPGFLALREHAGVRGLLPAAAPSYPNQALLAAAEGSPCALQEAVLDQHFTQPPPRYNDGSLVKALEERGIGRPSTYASTIKLLVDRGYMARDNRRFYVESRGRVLDVFLRQYFARYVDYDFTSVMESQLDLVSEGELGWTEVLQDFWAPFKAEVDALRDLRVRDVVDLLDEVLGPLVFPEDGAGAGDGAGADPRACQKCADGRLGLKLGRNGAFIGCSNFAAGCDATLPLTSFVDRAAARAAGDEAAAAAPMAVFPRALGTDPASGLEVAVRVGPYGPYLQQGASPEEAGALFKRVQLKGRKPESVTLAEALADLEFPKALGAHPVDGEPVVLQRGRFGHYVEHGQRIAPTRDEPDPAAVPLERAVAILAERGKARRARKAPGAKRGKRRGKEKGKGKPAAAEAGGGRSAKPGAKRGLTGYQVSRGAAGAAAGTAEPGLTFPNSTALHEGVAARRGGGAPGRGAGRGDEAAGRGVAGPAGGRAGRLRRAGPGAEGGGRGGA